MHTSVLSTFLVSVHQSSVTKRLNGVVSSYYCITFFKHGKYLQRGQSSQSFRVTRDTGMFTFLIHYIKFSSNAATSFSDETRAFISGVYKSKQRP